MKLSALLVLACTLPLFGCQKKTVELVKKTIELAEIVTNNTCLSIPSYASKMSQLESVSFYEITTDFEASSKNGMRENFRKALAFGSFYVGERPLNQIYEIQNIEQTDCESINLNNPDGTSTAYKIKDSGKSFLRASNQKGEELIYRFLSPQSLQIESKRQAFDTLCSQGQAGIWVTLTKTIHWGSSLPAVAERNSDFYISEDFLRMVGQVADYNVRNLYEADALLVSKAAELQQMPPRPEIVDCRYQGSPVNDELHQPPADEPIEEIIDDESSTSDEHHT